MTDLQIFLWYLSLSQTRQRRALKFAKQLVTFGICGDLIQALTLIQNGTEHSRIFRHYRAS